MNADKLAAKSSRGDREAFGKLYDLFSKRIYAYNYYRLYNKENAEDLTGAVFLKALEKLHTFKPEAGSFSAWIYGIARNTLTDHFRNGINSVDTGIFDVWDIPTESTVEIDAENRDQWERLKPFLAKLPADQREIIILRLWEDLPYREIAKILGKSDDSCKMAFSRALAFLRASMPLSILAAFLFSKQPLT